MACSQVLSGLIRDCETSIGGIVAVYIANAEDVSSVTAADGKISAIKMSDIKKFKTYAFRRGTGSMSSTLNVDPASGVNYVSTELVLQFNRMEVTKRVEMAALAVNDLAVIVKDANGVCWYLGLDEPVTASAGDGQTGTARGDANRYTITLLDNAKSFPCEIDSSVVEPLVD